MPLPTRPAVKPALRQVWRDATTLQLGVVPGSAIVLTGMQAGDALLLELLDGSREISAVLTDAAALGVDPQRGVELLRVLGAADALDEASVADAAPANTVLAPDRLSLSLLHSGAGAASRVLERRRAASVAVHGAGRIGASLTGLLTASGVGNVTVVDSGPARPSDTHPGGIRAPQPGTRAAAAALTFGARSHREEIQHERHDVDVVAPVAAVASPEVLAAVRHRPHLLVAVRETTAVVGPFVRPGHTPCLRCVELGRRDRDPGWAGVTAQLVGSAQAIEPCDVTLAALAASLAALQVLTHIDAVDRPDTEGGVLEFGLAGRRLRRRSVSAHPACGCGAGSSAETMDV
jgi:bacteriocin biosynthesis cyclodehydratase domain-containing protein